MKTQCQKYTQQELENDVYVQSLLRMVKDPADGPDKAVEVMFYFKHLSIYSNIASTQLQLSNPHQLILLSRNKEDVVNNVEMKAHFRHNDFHLIDAQFKPLGYQWHPIPSNFSTWEEYQNFIDEQIEADPEKYVHSFQRMYQEESGKPFTDEQYKEYVKQWKERRKR